MNKELIRYEIDPHNRLIIDKTGKESEVTGFRTVLDGSFEIGQGNQLIYHVKQSQGKDIPQQLKLKGSWSLDKEHNLVFTLDKWGNQIFGNKLILESRIIDAKSNELAFSLTTQDAKRNSRVYILKLSGTWLADEYNRLSFSIEKEKGVTDRLTLQGAWLVNKQNELIYTYERSLRGKKKKVTNSITFKGYWDIVEKCRLSYVLNKELGPAFDFKVSAGKPDTRGLRYEVGVGVTPAKKTITLFGTWKINKNLGLLFEMPRQDGKVNKVVLGAWCKFNKDLDLELRLENKSGDDLGIDLKLSKAILNNQGEAFVRALKSQKEVSIVAGVGFRW